MNPARKSAFLSRLAQDTAGNTLAIMAAAFFPLAGLIGGGVDMTRIYITKTRLQQACDAGALSGRKAMGAGAWSTAAGGSRDQADALFAANFTDGDFGTDNLDSEFTEDDGTVTGTASVEVPMTLMRIFGQEARTISVTCTANMEIPNTDVMFVLDVTFSMQTDDRIGGLHSATKCFYEALLKVNTTEPCTPGEDEDDEYTSADDPAATTYDGTAQIRLGFVPYAVNVNVGKLLPTAYVSDTWTYPTRRPNFTTVHAWQPTGASPTEPSTWGGWSAGTIPSNADRANQYNATWTVVPGDDSLMTTMQSGGSFRKRLTSSTTPQVDDEADCLARNSWSDENDLVGIQWSDGTAGSPTYTEGTAPTWVSPGNPATQSMNASRTRTQTITFGYKYRWHKNGGTSNSCWLESAAKTATASTFTQTQTGTGSRPITWTDYQSFNNTWDYSQQTLNVSALKSGLNWASSAAALTHTEAGEVTGTQTGPTVKLSGSNTNTPLTVPGNLSVTWDGCILERPTLVNTDGTPGDEWDPVPEEALDMDIIHVPSAATPQQAWGPMLHRAMWGREDASGNWTNSPRSNVSGAGYPAGTGSSSIFNYHQCPVAARKLAEYPTADQAIGSLTSFEAYIDSLAATGYGTYHDIGLLWGARLLSPVGIFANENALTADGGAIERHLIFMTDGDAQTVNTNIDSHGWHTFDRGQTNYAPSNGQLDALVEARLPALCTAIKAMNIQLWVISYGGDVDETNETRLEECASPGHYYEASDGGALISRFKQIAAEIADLRLTQ
jgi:Flp pilus assembly protein TadG